MIDHNNKNFILAIVLSMAIIFGWQYFYAVPIAEQAKHEAATSQTTTPRRRHRCRALPSPRSQSPANRLWQAPPD